MSVTRPGDSVASPAQRSVAAAAEECPLHGEPMGTESSSVRAARDLVDLIRRNNTMDGILQDEENQGGTLLGATLELVSSHLYDAPTHFLLELIQNADDNTYDCETPSLTFTYKNGSLRVDCNEVGFNERDVRAICNIAGSTKAGASLSHRYIGEKGIGFKSVFKVANVVYISSGPFSFKFDKSVKLGLIAPIWATFPEEALPGETSFFLQLSGDSDDEIVRRIHEFDRAILVFLRRLRRINLEIKLPQVPEITRVMRREDRQECGYVLTTIHQGSSAYDYLVIKHRVTGLPTDEKRCRESELQLAFPTTVDQGTRPTPTSHSVYAFLPIRDYGFQFLLQGDFLLTANRESIIDCPWNRALRDATADAFVKSVECFNAGPQKHTWLHYLPPNNVPEFFRSLKKKILGRLATHQVLESCNNTMHLPILLTYVPPEFCYQNGLKEPFTLCSLTSTGYLSMQYPRWAAQEISCLGVKTLDATGFLVHLVSMVSEEPMVFRKKSKQWHSELARVLLSGSFNDRDRLTLMDLEIVPLRNGEWATPRSWSLCFENNNFSVPCSVTVDIVDPEAETDPSRYSLFAQLGVRPCSPSDISRHIISMHNADSFDPRILSRHELVSHAVFLFKSSFRPPEGSNLWFVSTTEEHHKGSSLYMPEGFEQSTVEAGIMKNLLTKFPFIHHDYLEVLREEKGWNGWLRNSFGLSRIPRIHMANPGCPGRFQLSEEFKFLCSTCTSSDVLLLLRENWPEYSKWVEDFDQLEEPDLSEKTIRDSIKAWEVKCQNARCTTLQRTVLPGLDQVVDECSLVPALSLSDPDNSKWSFLHAFGVSTKRNLHYYLHCLWSMAGHFPSKETVRHVYQQIQIDYRNNEDLVWDSFRKNELIYTQSGLACETSRMRWISMQECIQSGTSVSTEYEECAGFFRCLLAYGRHDLGQLVEVATNIATLTERSDMLAHFVTISRILEGLGPGDVKKAVETLRKKRIFPILCQEASADHVEFAALDAHHEHSSTWFIADRHHLRNSFVGRVNLLAFAVEDIGSFEKLTTALELTNRKLSALVRSETSPYGATDFSQLGTESLRAKAAYITALIPKSNPDRENIKSRIERVTLHSAEKIVRKYSLTYGGSTYNGTSDVGQVASSIRGDCLQLFMCRHDIEAPAYLFELVVLVVDYCGITNPAHRDLLHATFSESNPKRLKELFHKAGVRIPEEVFAEKEKKNENKRKYAALGSEDLVLPPPSKRPKYPDDVVNLSMFKRSFEPEKRPLPIRVFEESQGLVVVKAVNSAPTILVEVLGSSNHAQYLGELMTSKALQNRLGRVYSPMKHWTSQLRSLGGYTHFDRHISTFASFTIADFQGVKSATEFLIQDLRFSEAEKWRAHPPSYHIEVVVTPGDSTSSFSWSTPQFERMRKFRIDKRSRSIPKNVLILMRVCHIYSQPRLDVFVDPWRLVVNHRFTLRDNWRLAANIDIENTFDKSNTSLRSRNRGYRNESRSASPRRRNLGTPIQLDFGGWRTPSRFTGTENISWYRYRPLGKENIRLLMLHPSDNGSLEGVILHTPLRLAGTFHAVSYTWGKDDLTHSLQTPEGVVKITSSLREALLQVRHETEPLILWVDAICINQNNATEKRDQIRLLPHVFQRANSVLACLGSDGNSDDALEALMQIHMVEELRISGKKWPDHSATMRPIWAQVPIPPSNHAIWGKIDRFFERHWFQRAWIIQEIVVAIKVKVLCGKWVVDWNALFHAVEIITRESRPNVSASFQMLQPKWKTFLALAKQRELEAQGCRLPLISLLENFRYAKSTLQRDRLFCFLGLAKDGDNPDFDPDYDSGFSVIILKYAEAFLHHGHVMELLHRAGLNSRPERFPTWIPDWTIRRQNSIRELSTRGMPCSSSANQQPRFEHDKGSHLLRVHGIQIDVIDATTRSTNVREEMHDYLSEIEKLIANQSPKCDPELKWKVPIAGAWHPRVVVSEQTDMKASYAALRAYLALERDTELGPSQEASKRKSGCNFEGTHSPRASGDTSLPVDGQNYFLALQENLKGWRFFVTSKGYYGTAPPEATPGDVVAIIDGGVVPFLIRKSSSRQGCFQLIGECYVHGLMEHGKCVYNGTEGMISLY